MTEEKNQAEEIIRGQFTVTLEDGQSFNFRQGTLAERIETDLAYDYVDNAKTASDVINKVLPVITAQLIDPSIDLMSLIDLPQLMELLAAFRLNATIDLRTKKNSELP